MFDLSYLLSLAPNPETRIFALMWIAVSLIAGLAFTLGFLIGERMQPRCGYAPKRDHKGRFM